MNQYAAMAQRHWETYLPHRVAQLTNPTTFFETLGQEVAEEIDQLTDQLAGPDQRNETYLGKVGRLNAARDQAREKVLAERVLLPPDPGTPQDEDTPQQQDSPQTQQPDPGWIPTRPDPQHPWWAQELEPDE